LTTLELVLSPADATRLPRLRRLSGLRAGRSRRRAIEIIWHDTTDGELAAQGLALAECRGTWRLEQLVPGPAFWPPGAPPPLVEQAASLDQITHKLPTGLVQTARFDGSLTALPLARDGAAMTIELWHGTVGWARRRRPACRVVLAGDEAGIRDLALDLTEEVDFAVPTASLAADARAVATAITPAARHQGAPQLPAKLPDDGLPGGQPEGLTVAEAFRYALGHLADVILHHAPLAAAGRDGAEPVHEMRVAVRRLRSTIALFRPAVGCPAMDTTSLSLRALAERLAPARDWDVFVAETAASVAEALPDDVSLQRLCAAAERRRQHAYTTLRDWLRSAEFRRLGITLASLAGGHAWMATLEPAQQATLTLGLDEFASHALGRRLKRLGAAGAAIEQLEPDALHAIRLRAKRMRYAAEVLAPIYPGKAAKRFLRRLTRLQDRLGDLNDGTVANALLAELGPTTGARAYAAGLVRGFLAARTGNSRRQIARAWNRFRRLDPFWR
jgi:CHAD domain-containing protein